MQQQKMLLINKKKREAGVRAAHSGPQHVQHSSQPTCSAQWAQTNPHEAPTSHAHDRTPRRAPPPSAKAGAEVLVGHEEHAVARRGAVEPRGQPPPEPGGALCAVDRGDDLEAPARRRRRTRMARRAWRATADHGPGPAAAAAAIAALHARFRDVERIVEDLVTIRRRSVVPSFVVVCPRSALRLGSDTARSTREGRGEGRARVSARTSRRAREGRGEGRARASARPRGRALRLFGGRSYTPPQIEAGSKRGAVRHDDRAQRPTTARRDR